MKKMTLTIIFALACLLMVPTHSLADNGDAVEKLKKGAKQLVTAPVEIPKTTAFVTESMDNKLVGAVGGILEGSMRMLQQGVSGIVNVFTFPWTDFEC